MGGTGKSKQRGKLSPQIFCWFSPRGEVWAETERFPLFAVGPPPGGRRRGSSAASDVEKRQGKGRAKVKGRRGRDRKQKRKDRSEQGQHAKS